MKKQLSNGATRTTVLDYALEKYATVPEYLWIPFPNYAVLRRADNKKWYAIIMDVPKNSLGLNGNERVDILDIKCNAFVREMLLRQKGFLSAYHLNRENWITALLDGSVDTTTLLDLIDQSYQIAQGKNAKAARFEPTSWLVPANPKFFDLEKAFAEAKNDEILWKQSNSVIVGDTVYLYVAAPFSCVLYKCEVTETDIPYNYDDGNVRMSKVMKLKRWHTFERDVFGVAELKEHGIVSVRGPRHIPYGLLYKLEKASEQNN